MKVLPMMLPLLVLAGCGDDSTVSARNASVEEVAGKVKASGTSVRMNPGEWVTEAKMESFEAPGLPPAAATQMKKMMTHMVTGHRYCLTPEMISRPREDFFGGKHSGCTYERFDMGGGKISGVMNCGSNGRMQRIILDGHYSPDHYDMRMDQNVEGGGQGGMKMVISMSSNRVGECTKEDEKADS